MGTPFKMKGSPMQRNFGIGSPMTQPEKSTEIMDNQKSESEMREWLNSQKHTKNAKKPVYLFGGDVNNNNQVNDIWNKTNDEYLKKGNPNLSGSERVEYFKNKGNEEVAIVEKSNAKSRAYLKSLEGILPTKEQAAGSKGTLRETPKPNNSKIVKLKNKAVKTIKNLFGN